MRSSRPATQALCRRKRKSRLRFMQHTQESSSPGPLPQRDPSQVWCTGVDSSVTRSHSNAFCTNGGTGVIFSYKSHATTVRVTEEVIDLHSTSMPNGRHGNRSLSARRERRRVQSLRVPVNRCARYWGSSGKPTSGHPSLPVSAETQRLSSCRDDLGEWPLDVRHRLFRCRPFRERVANLTKPEQ